MTGPQQPWRPPPGGYPPQWPGQPPPPYPPPARKRGPWRWLVPLLVVLVALGVGIPLLVINSTSDGPVAERTASARPGAQVKPWLRANEAPIQNQLNTWLHGENLVVAYATGVTAYDRKTGAVRWRVSAPEVSGWPASGPVDFCGASEDISGNRVALSFGHRTDAHGSPLCAYATVLHLGTGKLGWQTQLVPPSEAEDAVNFPKGVPVAVAGDTVFVGFGNQLGGLSLADGSQRWMKTLQSSGQQWDCPVVDLDAGDAERVYFVSRCDGDERNPLGLGWLDSTGSGQVQSISLADTGLTDVAGGNLVSTSPPVVAIGDIARHDVGRYMVYDQELRLRGSIASDDGKTSRDAPAFAMYSGAGLPGSFHQDFRLLVHDDVMITVTSLAQQDKPNKLMAIDLATGQTKWAVTLGQNRLLAPVAVDGDSVVVAGAANLGQGGQTLLRASLADGSLQGTKERQDISVSSASTQPGFSFEPTSMKYDWADGRLYAVCWSNTAGLQWGTFTIG